MRLNHVLLLRHHIALENSDVVQVVDPDVLRCEYTSGSRLSSILPWSAPVEGVLIICAA